MKNLRHGIEYILIIVVCSLVRLLPIGIYPLLSRISGRLAALCTPSRVKIAIDNLRSVFPSYSPEQLRQITHGIYRNLAGNAVDIAKPKKMIKLIEIPDQVQSRFDEIKKISQAGRPVIFCSAHYGAWEVLGQFLGREFPNISILAKTQSNRHVNNWINRKRVMFGGMIVSSDQANKVLLARFRQGQPFFFAGDQYGGEHGVVTDFLGRPTSYYRGLATYSYRYNALVVLLLLTRNNPGYTLNIARVIEPDTNAPVQDEIRRILTIYSEELGRYVETSPEQWLWTHRRWKE